MDQFRSRFLAAIAAALTFLSPLLAAVPVPAYAVTAAELPGDDDPEVGTCLVLEHNMRYRARDSRTEGEVSLLQDFLQTEGFLQREPTGLIDLKTLKAVKDFQKSVGFRPTGYVGDMTREKIAEVSCGEEAEDGQVYSPVAGDTWNIGASYVVRWDKDSFHGADTVSIALVNGDDGSVCAFDGIANTGSYTFGVPSNTEFGSCIGPITAGHNYQLVLSNKNASLTSGTFTVMGTSSSVSVHVMTDKDTYRTGQTMLFTVKAVDADGTPFTSEEGAVVDLRQISSNGSGDYTSRMRYNPSSRYYEYSTTAAITADWTAYATVMRNGSVVATSGKVQYTVASAYSTLSIAMSSSTPGPQTVAPGATNVTFAVIEMRAGSQDVNNMNGIQIGSLNADPDRLFRNGRVYDGSRLIATFDSLSWNGSYSWVWVKPQDFTISAYGRKTLTIRADIKTTAPQKAQFNFGIAGLNFSGGAIAGGLPVYGSWVTVSSVGSSSSSFPSVTVFSPNGGETWKIGETKTITYRVPPSSSDILIYLEKGYEPGSLKQGVNSSMLIGETTDPSQYSYVLPSSIASWPGLGSNFWIKVCVNRCATFDRSDSTFTIATAEVFSASAWADKSSYVPGETMLWQAKVLNGPGDPFTPEEGAEVRANLTGPDGKVYGERLMRYNTSTSYYEWREQATSFNLGRWSFEVRALKNGKEVARAPRATYTVAESANLPPVIDGINAPSSLEVGQSGTWTVSAHDPENKPLSYAVFWGDEVSFSPVSPNAHSNQSASFTHTYQNPGIYTVQVRVTDDAGSTESVSATVNVGTAQPSISIIQESLPSTATAVAGAQNVLLLRFKALGSRTNDVLFTKLIVDSAGEGITLKNGVRYKLWVDSDGNGVVDTILDSAEAVNDGQGWAVTFDSLPSEGWRIPKEMSFVFEVRGDIASTLQSSPTLQLRFATGRTYVGAERMDNHAALQGIGTDGRCATAGCQIAVTTATSTLWNLVMGIL